MKTKNFSGDYLNAFLSDAYFKEDTESIKINDKKIKVSKNELAYVYSFKEGKLTYLKGFDTILGLNHTDINIKKIHFLFRENYIEFFKEFHDRVLLYFHNNNNNIESIGCNALVLLKNIETPVNHSVRVFETDNNGNLVSVIIRMKLNEKLKIGDIIQYCITGEIHEKALKEEKYFLNYKKCISKREAEIIESFIDKEKSNKIFSKVLLKPEEFVVVLENLIIRFGLQTKAELIEFAKENYLIPSQFKKIDL